MQKIKASSETKLEFNVTLKLTEGEARALEAICGYGPTRFVEWFYRNLGKHYLKPHEIAMRSLFETVRSELPIQLSKIDNARKVLKENGL